MFVCCCLIACLFVFVLLIESNRSIFHQFLVVSLVSPSNFEVLGEFLCYLGFSWIFFYHIRFMNSGVVIVNNRTKIMNHHMLLSYSTSTRLQFVLLFCCCEISWIDVYLFNWQLYVLFVFQKNWICLLKFLFSLFNMYI